MSDNPRLIEKAFLLREVSLDSVHEKNVRHGHISTLHIWPARRPLAACRAALIATLLDDPGTPEKREEVLRKMAGRKVIDHDGKETTEGGILHWKRETENADTLRWFREEIRAKYGRAPKVLDPFAGGGAIPLEAMRLGCETTATDINPVAWFVLKCTLDYPHRFAGKLMPLPEFVKTDREFLEAWFGREVNGKKKSKKKVQEAVDSVLNEGLFGDARDWQADLAWHIRAWGRWVLKEARKDLAPYYPTYAEWQPVDGWNGRVPTAPSDTDAEEVGGKWLKRVAVTSDGKPLTSEDLNIGLAASDLSDPRKPRWIVKPTLAYQWARTVRCQNQMCRAEIPLLSTTWLVNKRTSPAFLRFQVDRQLGTVEIFPVQGEEPNADDVARTVGGGGAKCLVCDLVTKDSQLRHEFASGRTNKRLTTVVVQGTRSKEFRRPTSAEEDCIRLAAASRDARMSELPGGDLDERMPDARRQGNSGFRVLLYGYSRWRDLFEDRQAVGLASISKSIRAAHQELERCFELETADSVSAYLACMLARVVDRSTNVCRSDPSPTQSGVINTFSQFNIPMNFDFIETCIVGDGSGSFANGIEWVSKALEHFLGAAAGEPSVELNSATADNSSENGYDVVFTDPPYYDTFAYGDLSDVFLCWHRRTLAGLSPEFAPIESYGESPKSNSGATESELIVDPGRFEGNRAASVSAYEDGMRSAFEKCGLQLVPTGRLVIVFANKNPDAWEALVSALIRAGFAVTASWPIETEMGNRTRANAVSALASSIWVVCRKRPEGARSGWDNEVVQRMSSTITTRLREFWDLGIRGPDFVWSAVGPALEEYSQHPVVKKTSGQGVMTVKEFLEHVRRIVVDFVVGRVFTEGGQAEGSVDVASIDNITAYYLLHRHDFAFETAPIGACILYAISCGTTDARLAGAADILMKPNKKQALGEDDESDDIEDGDKKKSNMVRLKRWNERTRKDLGEPNENDVPPLIDRVHRLMDLWKAGDQDDVNEYIADLGLQHDRLFVQLMQAMIELARKDKAADELQILEAVMNHLKRNGNITAPDRTGEKQARVGKKVKLEEPSLFGPDEIPVANVVRERRRGANKN